MSAFVLVSGVLHRAPESRTSRNGNAFTTATLRAKDKDGDATMWWKVVAFADAAQVQLLALGDGDAVSIQGPMRAEIYQPEGGDPRVSLSVVADMVTPLRRPKAKADARQSEGDRRRAFPDEGPMQRHPRATAVEPDPALNDPIPW